MNNPFAFPTKNNHWVHRLVKKCFSFFGKKGKPHDSVTATLKTSPQTAVDGLVWNWGLL